MILLSLFPPPLSSFGPVAKRHRHRRTELGNLLIAAFAGFSFSFIYLGLFIRWMTNADHVRNGTGNRLPTRFQPRFSITLDIVA